MCWDRDALVALCLARNGPNWRKSENRLTHAPPGTWCSVETDYWNRVVAANRYKLDLPEHPPLAS